MISVSALSAAFRVSWRNVPTRVLAIVLGAMFLGTLLGLVSRAREAAALLLLLSILGIVLAFPHAIRIARGRWDPFDPLVAFTAICGVGYFLPSIHLLWHEKGDLYHIPVDTLEAIDLLGVGVTLVIMAILSFYLGYGSRVAPAVARRLPLISNIWTARRLRFVWIALTIVGGGAYAIFVVRSGGLLNIITNMELRSEVSAGAHIYTMFIRWMPMALLFRQVLLFRANASRLAWFSFGIHAFAVIVLLALLGSRAWAFEVLFLMLVVRHFLHRPIRFQSLVILVLTALLVFAVYDQYRAITHDGVEASELSLAEVDRVDAFHQGVLGGRNFDMMDNLLSLIYFTGDRFDFRQGGVGSLPVQKVDVWGFGGAPLGAIGEAYLNYSWLGVVPALLLLGLFARLVREYPVGARTNAFAVFVLAIGFVFVMMVTRGSFFNVGSTFVMRFVPLLIGALIASGLKWERRPRSSGRRRRRRRSRHRSARARAAEDLISP